MHIHKVMDDVLKVVVTLIERTVRKPHQRTLGLVHVLPARGVAQCQGSRLTDGQHGGLDAVQDLVRPSSLLLNVIRVAVEHFHDGQGPFRFGQLARHLVRGLQRAIKA